MFQEAWRRLLCKLDGLKQIHWDEAIGDGTFSQTKKSNRRRGHRTAGASVGLTKRGKRTKVMLMVDSAGTPLSAFTYAANVPEVNAI